MLVLLLTVAVSFGARKAHTLPLSGGLYAKTGLSHVPNTTLNAFDFIPELSNDMRVSKFFCEARPKILTSIEGNFSSGSKQCSWIIAPENRSRSVDLLLNINADLDISCSSMNVFECDTNECQNLNFIQSIQGKQNFGPFVSSTGIIFVEYYPYSYCSLPSVFFGKYLLTCPDGYYGSNLRFCSRCGQHCIQGKLPLSQCSRGTIEDTPCTCPYGFFSPELDANCSECVANCLPDQVVSDFHTCPAGTTFNFIACSQLVTGPNGKRLGLREAIKRLQDNDILMISPGYYTGSGSCGAELSGSNITLMAEGGLGSVIIDCNGEARNLIVRGNGMRLVDLVLQGGLANREGNSSSNGGCLQVLGDALEVVNTQFIKCKAQGSGGAIFVANYSITMTGVEVRHCQAGSQGGGLWADGGGNGTVHMTNCTFGGNAAGSLGGAVFTSNKQLAHYAQMTFNDNSAGIAGGAIFSDLGIKISLNSTFYNNTARDGFGGAICIGLDPDDLQGQFNFNIECPLLAISKTLEIAGIVAFEGNAARFGGAIYSSCSSVAMGNNTIFAANYASLNGGAINIWSGTLEVAGNARFVENVASNFGGALSIDRGSLIVKDDALFEGNRADEAPYWTRSPEDCFGSCLVAGGAVFVGSDSVVSIAGSSRFIFNVVTTQEASSGYGGAIFVFGQNTTLLIEDESVFSSNRAGDLEKERPYEGKICFWYTCVDFGGGALGAIGWSSSSGIEINIRDNVRLLNNSAFSGGALFLSGNVLLNVKGSVQLEDNKALNGHGGGLYAEESSVEITDSVSLRSNQAFFVHGRNPSAGSGDGGAIYSSCPDCTYFDTEGLKVNGQVLFSQNTASGSGGAVLIYGCYSCAGVNPKALSSRFSGSVLFVGNVAGVSGGSISILDFRGTTHTVSDHVSFVSNMASETGGAIFFMQSESGFAFLNVTDQANISFNYADDGGSIYVTGPIMVSFSSSVSIVDNVAGSRGGAVFASGSAMVNISDQVIFARNVASEGGALFHLESRSTIVGSVVFHDNVGLSNGGCVFLENSRFEVQGTKISQNIAMNSGGAISSSASNIILSKDARLVRNLATQGNGGAVDLQASSKLTASGTLLDGNFADRSGGALSASSSSEVYLYAGTVVRRNIAKGGGGFAFQDKSNGLVATGVTFLSNSAQGAEWACINAQCSGGAISATDKAHVTILEGSIFNGNWAIGNGGAVMVGGTAQLSFAGLIANCSAKGSGGGIASDGLSIVRALRGSNLVNNSASGNGGGIALSGAESEFGTDLHIENCKAGQNGGGIFLGIPLTIVGTIMIESCSALNGGGMALSGLPAVLIILSSKGRLDIIGNFARNDGGGLALNDGSRFAIETRSECSDCNAGILLWPVALNVSLNKCGRNGGGVFTGFCPLQESPCFFTGLKNESSADVVVYTGNTAEGAGGASFLMCENMPKSCQRLLDQGIGIDTTIDVKAIFISNKAKGYGNDLATKPASFILLGHFTNKKLQVCSNHSLHRNLPSGSVEIVQVEESQHICTIKLAPFAAEWITITVSFPERLASRIQETSCKDSENSFTVHECVDVTCLSIRKIGLWCWSSRTRGEDDSDPQKRSESSITSTTGIVMLVAYWPVFQVNTGFLRPTVTFNSHPLFEASTDLIPGQQFVDLTVVIVDGMLTVIPASASQEAVAVLLCSPFVSSCDTYTSLALGDYFGFDRQGVCNIVGRKPIICGFNESIVDVQLSLGSSGLDPFKWSIRCLPCRQGEARTLSNTGENWFCKTCLTGEYILDPNNDRFTCQSCPKGAVCDGNSLMGRANGSIWLKDFSIGQYRLVSCPPGHLFVNSSDGQHFSHSAQECVRCGSDQYIVDSNNPKFSCNTCPIGAHCNGASLQGLANGSIWEPDMETGQFMLRSCPQGHQFVNVSQGVFSVQAQQCLPCKRTEYIIDSNNPAYSCQPCPVGATCTNFLLNSNVPGSVWTPDSASGQYMLMSCPPGYELLNTAGESGVFSYVNQRCSYCPPAYFCVGGMELRSACPKDKFAVAGSNSSKACSTAVFVEVVLVLPVVKAELVAAKQQNISEAVASTAGVDVGLVVLVSVVDVSRRLSISPAMQLDFNLAAQSTEEADTISRRVSAAEMNRQLSIRGLPAALSVGVGVLASAPESSTYSLAAVIAGTICSVFIVTCILASLLYIWVENHASASRRLIGAKHGTSANQYDLPTELRSKYEAVQVLGTGSFGVVMESWQLNHGKRSVLRAIKIIHSVGRRFTEQELRRIMREANLMSKIDSPYVVQFIEAGKCRSCDCFWIVMEYLNGRSLKQVLEETGNLSEVEVIRIGLDVCAALKTIHNLGVVNRDVKPENILQLERQVGTVTSSRVSSSTASILKFPVKPAGTPTNNSDLEGSIRSELAIAEKRIKVGDLPAQNQGTAKRLSVSRTTGVLLYKLVDLGTAVGVEEISEGEEATSASASMMTLSAIEFAGTPAYSAPECFVSPEKVSFTADIWSLSATLFHLVTGKLPFDCSTPIAASINIASDLDATAPDLRDAAPEHIRALITTPFAEVVARGLMKRPEKRFETVDEMASALHGCLVSRGEELYSAFISYRVRSEKYHAQLIYDLLNNTTTPSGRRVIVYLDSKRLVKGEDWEEGFSLGLLNSLVALPLLSEGALKPLSWLSGDSDDRKDNLGKELTTMLALQEEKNVRTQCIYPMLVGPPRQPDDPLYPFTGSFFSPEVTVLLNSMVDKPSPPTAAAAADFLRRHGLLAAAAAAETLTPRSIVNNLLARQGADLSAAGVGAERAALELLVHGDSDLWTRASASPPDPPLDLEQLRALKLELRELVPAIHEVIDRVYVATQRQAVTPLNCAADK